MQVRQLPRQPAPLRHTWLAAGLAALFVAILPAQVAGGSLLEPGYRTDRFSFRPSAGEQVTVQYQLLRAAAVTLVVHDSDHRPVSTLLRAMRQQPGAASVRWTGRDDAGGALPRGVYYFVFEAVGDPGSEVHDPAMTSGGEVLRLTFGDYSYDRAAGKFRFNLPRPAWVRIRAGVHEGPLLATPADWEPFDAGSHEVAWDGRDADGLLDVAGHPKFSHVLQAFALPAGSVYLAEGAAPVRALPGKHSAAVAERQRAVRKASLTRGPVDPTYFTPAAYRRSPLFSASVGGRLAKTSTGVVVADLSVPLTVTLDPQSATQMVEQRFEIVTYVDQVRVAEEEQGYSPCTIEVPVNELPEGEHIISVSVVSLTDQGATRSFKVQVQHPAMSR
jgi:hypothetical protein